MKSIKSEYEELKSYTIKLQQKIDNLAEDNEKLKSVITTLTKSPSSTDVCINKHSRLIDGICQLWGVDLTDLFLPVRHRRIVEARQVAMFAIRHNTELSFAEIGARFGAKDHSTVIYAIKKVNDLAATDRSYMNKLIILNVDKWLITS